MITSKLYYMGDKERPREMDRALSWFTTHNLLTCKYKGGAAGGFLYKWMGVLPDQMF